MFLSLFPTEPKGWNMSAGHSICPLEISAQFASKMYSDDEACNECKAYEEC